MMWKMPPASHGWDDAGAFTLHTGSFHTPAPASGVDNFANPGHLLSTTRVAIKATFP